MHQTRLQMRSTLLAAVMLSAMALVACGADPDQVESNILKGTVKDHAGTPLAGVKVTAWDALENWSRVEGITDAQGAYRIQLDPERVTQYHVEAEMTVSWDGQDWLIKMHPENQTMVPHEGGVRDLVWRVHGEMPGAGYYGGSVQVLANMDVVQFEFGDVELDFVPNGPRIDGSTGAPFTMKLSDGNLREDVPLGRYTVTARVAGESPLPLRLRVYDEGDFVSELDTGFQSHDGWSDRILEITAD